MVLVPEKTEVDVWNRIESSEIDPPEDFCGAVQWLRLHSFTAGHGVKRLVGHGRGGGGGGVGTRIPHASRCGQKRKKK